ncbi:M23 family metallopeptidase [Hydrogenothermus marinus]|uniref:Murein DD-endopeptidase MepM/ murein hydrolase activator NlpD n=1 Tax=Hydrogenothermus marinus TaxID=133270 RepID=A0A3M0BFY3_9AQUI|nr:M23 family metallopeptidase [Hydrogenothermus marinus]RMA96061.1 murein DD-endopeptidase MepM/ murein hydrolase activator NlpD [Hydrogenothermus marinus]
MDKKIKFLYIYTVGLTIFSFIIFYILINTKKDYKEFQKNYQTEIVSLQKEVLVLKEILKDREKELEKTKKEKEEIETKLKNIEEKIKKANHYLERKGIKVELPEGGIYIPENSKKIHLYAGNLEKSITKLLKTIQDIPVGVPLYGKITSGFGVRRDPFTGKKAFHTGIDLRATFKQPVFATANGKVVYAGWGRGYGKMVKIKHKYGFTTLYAHMYYIKVKTGQYVKAGQIIGYAGSTGRSTGVHLHYEIRRYGKLIDPKKMLYLNSKNRI